MPLHCLPQPQHHLFDVIVHDCLNYIATNELDVGGVNWHIANLFHSMLPKTCPLMSVVSLQLVYILWLYTLKLDNSTEQGRFYLVTINHYAEFAIPDLHLMHHVKISSIASFVSTKERSLCITQFRNSYNCALNHAKLGQAISPIWAAVKKYNPNILIIHCVVGLT